MRTFAIGDIHGAYAALLQCIQSSGIDRNEDQLIVLGDVVDGWPVIPECIDELLTFKNLIAIRGNHDQWFMDWARAGTIDRAWYVQGGSTTLLRYESHPELTIRHMNDYFANTKIYYVDKERNYAFMHGGYDWHKPLSENDENDIMWDRHLLETAHMWDNFNKCHGTDDHFKEFDKIFVGHTTTQHSFSKKKEPSLLPAMPVNVVNLDTGGGWSGKLTIMNVDTLEYWQSDLVPDLYPNIKRN